MYKCILSRILGSNCIKDADMMYANEGYVRKSQFAATEKRPPPKLALTYAKHENFFYVAISVTKRSKEWVNAKLWIYKQVR